MSRRELELTAARIADALNEGDPEIKRDSGMFTASIIQIVLNLRAKKQLHQSKALRLWLRVQTKRLAQTIALNKLDNSLKAHEEQFTKAKRLRDEIWQQHVKGVWAWKHAVESMSLWERVSRSTPPPEPPKLPILPKRPDHDSLARSYVKEHTFEQLLLDYIYYYRYPGVELSGQHTTEEYVKQKSIVLLERL